MRTRVCCAVFTLLLSLFCVTAETCSAPAPGGTVRCIGNSFVCMVEDRVPGVKMIPVEVEGGTYYACCPVCAGKLKLDRSVRFSRDPVTGREVDKSKAYILVREDQTVVYFESEKTARSFVYAE